MSGLQMMQPQRNGEIDVDFFFFFFFFFALQPKTPINKRTALYIRWSLELLPQIVFCL